MDSRELPGRIEGAERGQHPDVCLTGARPSPASRPLLALGACLVSGASALALYVATLLPGQDLGDTASFQLTVGTHLLEPRDAYPLYHALGAVFVWLWPAEPAWALNLASAAWGASAVAVLVAVAAAVTGSWLAGLFAGALLAGSYTFWSQAVIAEVYTLHLLLLGGCWAALVWWERKPAPKERALVLFFALYALSFGNHLSTILLAPGFVVFLLGTPDRRRLVLQPRPIAFALLLAACGALQYAWNLAYLWKAPQPPEGLTDLLATFWFDVTKADWRAAFVMGKGLSDFPDRLAMYWFDLRQQFGAAGAGLAVLGCAAGFRRWPVFTASVVVTFGVTWLFTITYNVGDLHVFYLVPHAAVALMAGAGALTAAHLIAARPRLWGPARLKPVMTAVLAVLLLYPAWRMFDTFPAATRRGDYQARDFLAGLTTGLDSRTSLLVTDLDWQIENGLDYYTRHTNPDLVTVPLGEVILHFPQLAWSNWAGGRDVVLAGRAGGVVRAAYDGLFEVRLDERHPVRALHERLAGMPRDGVYVVSVLQPYADKPLEPGAVERALQELAGGSVTVPEGRYVVIAGQTARPPALLVASDTPFRRTADLGGLRLDIRMESWLPTDTFRRAGFGHVIANRRPVLRLDRGVSAVVLDGQGRPLACEYLAALLAPQPRHVVRPAGGRVLSLSETRIP